MDEGLDESRVFENVPMYLSGLREALSYSEKCEVANFYGRGDR